MSLPLDLSGITTAWGPPAAPAALQFSNVPYAPFSKGDKLGKAADWQQQEFKDSKDKRQGKRDYFHAYGASAASSFAAEKADTQAEEFEVVDNSKVQRGGAAPTVLKRGGRGQGGVGSNFSNGAGYTTGGQQTQKKTFTKTNQQQQQKPYNNYNSYRRWNDKPERVRDASIKVEDSWTIVSDIELHKLNKVKFDVGAPETLGSYGSLFPYNKRIEKGGALKTIDKNIYNVTASDDPVIQSLYEKREAQVYTTDSVISQLMCASRSVYSWDIIVTKKDGQIYLNKRDGSQIDTLTVDENAMEAPSDTVDSNINNATNLSLEAIYINQNFAANVVSEDQTIQLENANPFTSGEPTVSKGYVYKKWLFKQSADEENPLSIVIRTEYDTKDPQTNQTLLVKAVNEYSNAGIDWKTKFNSQRGAIMAAEFKNNNNKMSKWTQQALLAGVDQIKLGFISRTNFKDNKHHDILGVTTFNTLELASQIGLNVGNGWGIVKSFIDIIMAQDDGQFVVLRQPNAQKVTVYKVPQDAFDEE